MKKMGLDHEVRPQISIFERRMVEAWLDKDLAKKIAFARSVDELVRLILDVNRTTSFTASIISQEMYSISLLRRPLEELDANISVTIKKVAHNGFILLRAIMVVFLLRSYELTYKKDLHIWDLAGFKLVPHYGKPSAVVGVWWPRMNAPRPSPEDPVFDWEYGPHGYPSLIQVGGRGPIYFAGTEIPATK